MSQRSYTVLTHSLGNVKKLNKTLGLKPKSEKIWDILFVSDLKRNMTGIATNITGLAANITEMAANINKNEV